MKTLAFSGIALIFLSFFTFFIPGEKTLYFCGTMALGAGLVLLYIVLTGRVPLRGPEWPHLFEKPVSALIGIAVYATLFFVMLRTLWHSIGL